MIDETTFRNLNARGAWPGFELDGVVRDPDGALRLAAVPGRPEPVGPVLAPAPSLDGPAGAAAARDGTLFVTEPGLDRVLQVDPCDGSAGPMACLGGTGVAAGMLRRPRGIALGPRDLLYVADSGNHRVQVFEPSSGQVVEVWGPSGPDEEPEASADPGRFDDPWDVAADGAGFVYVVDHGNARVQRLDADGRPDLAYAAALAAWAEPPVGPRHVRVVRLDGEERVVIVDRPAAPAADRLLVHRTDGSLDEQRTDAWGDLRRRATGQAPAPVPAIAGLAVLGGELFLGDPDGGVLAFTVDGTFLGPARGFGGRPASLHWDGEGRILVHPGGGAVAHRPHPRSGPPRVGHVRVGADRGPGHRRPVAACRGPRPRADRHRDRSWRARDSDSPSRPQTCPHRPCGRPDRRTSRTWRCSERPPATCGWPA